MEKPNLQRNTPDVIRHKLANMPHTNNFILLILPAILFSCKSNEVPECNSQEVKNQTIIKFKEQIKPVLVNELVEYNINKEDLQQYSFDRGLNYSDVLEEEVRNRELEFDPIMQTELEKTILKNIRVVNIEDEKKKCSCIADVEAGKLKLTLEYSAQMTEDNNKLIIDLNYYKNEK